jgi:hypothetical protein
VRAGVRDDRLAATVDIAPTIYDAAGVKRANRPELDGRSLLRSWDRNRLVLESWAWHGRPQWAATRTRHDLFVEYYEKDTIVARELYDLEKDPFGEQPVGRWRGRRARRGLAIGASRARQEMLKREVPLGCRLSPAQSAAMREVRLPAGFATNWRSREKRMKLVPGSATPRSIGPQCDGPSISSLLPIPQRDGRAPYSGMDLNRGNARAEPDPQLGLAWQVTISSRGDGGDKWADITGEAACETVGTPQRRVAIVLDRDIISSPEVAGARM